MASAGAVQVGGGRRPARRWPDQPGSAVAGAVRLSGGRSSTARGT